MVIAKWNQETIAESNETIVLEGNYYFPPGDVRKEFLRPSTHTSRCSWKGTANYYDIEVAGETNAQAAWYYPEPLEPAQNIRGYIAFWKGVEVSELG